MGGEKLIFGGSKVKHSDLGDSLMVAAFADLVTRGYLALELVEEKKLGLFSSRDVMVTRLGEPSERLTGLEAAIWDKLIGDPKEDRVRPITRRIIGAETGNPWSTVIDLAKEGLADQGYFNKETEELRFRPDKTHWSANDELIRPLEGLVEQVKTMLSSLETRDPGLYKQLVESVRGGIKDMVESPDFDMD